MDVASIMKGPRLKIERANGHIDSLIRDASPLSKDLYEIAFTGGTVLHLKPQPTEVTYRPKKPIPEHFALIMGDAIHNLRTSLDHWATAFVGTLLNNPGGRQAFPFDKKRENFETHSVYKTIEKASPDTAKFIRDEIQPYGDGKGRPLWLVTRLNNIDKHDFILPNVTVVGIEKMHIRIGKELVMEDCAVCGDASRQINLIRSRSPITIDKEFETAVQITFPQGNEFFENQPVIPTLLNLSEAVTKTLDALEDFIGRPPKPFS